MPYPRAWAAEPRRPGQRHPSEGHPLPVPPWPRRRPCDWSDGPGGSHHCPCRAGRHESDCRCESFQWHRQRERHFSSLPRTGGKTQKQRWAAAVFPRQGGYISWLQTMLFGALNQSGNKSLTGISRCIAGIPGSAHCSSVKSSSTGLPSGAVMIFFT